MTVVPTTHLNFRGQAREALEFYRSVVGGDLVVVTHGQAGPASPEEADLVLWGQVEAPNGFRVMAFDVPAAQPFDRGVDAVFVSLRGDDAEEAERVFTGLAEGAVVRTPWGPSPFSPGYGMLDDRFGVTWVVDVQPLSAG